MLPLLFVSVEAMASSKAMDALSKLDDIRLTKSLEFKEKLAEISSLSSQLNEQEKEYLVLLQGYDLALSGKYVEAVELLQALLQENQSKKNVILFRVKALVFNIYSLTKNHLNASFLLEEITNELIHIEDDKALAQAIPNIALFYNNIGMHELSVYYINNFKDKIKNKMLSCRIQPARVFSLMSLAKLDSKKNDFFNVADEAISLCDEMSEIIPKGLIVKDKISALNRVDHFQEAILAYENIIDEAVETEYPILIGYLKSAVSESYLGVGDYKMAETLALEAVQHAAVNPVNNALINAYRVLYQSLKSQQRYEQALIFFEKYSDLEKAYFDEQSDQQFAYNLAKVEVEIKNQRIALLDKDNELLSLQKDLYEQELKQNRLITIVLLSILMLASFLAYRGMSGRKRFKKIAEYDQLTGISNRYHFNNQAKVALDYCEKNAKPVAVILFDLDYFKNINDMHGHAAGDWALQQVVKTCRNFMRNNDVFGRIGGEEFAVVLPGCQTDKAVLLAEICRDAIAGIDSTDCGKQFPLSASFGVCGSDTSGYQLKQLLADADNAMYSAKEAGRDQVMAFSA